ncbi:unnamed protein product, partial [Amoebophrya sp. A120]
PRVGGRGSAAGATSRPGLVLNSDDDDDPNLETDPEHSPEEDLEFEVKKTPNKTSPGKNKAIFKEGSHKREDSFSLLDHACDSFSASRRYVGTCARVMNSDVATGGSTS